MGNSCLVRVDQYPQARSTDLVSAMPNGLWDVQHTL